jgi:hypothetical protein
MQGLLIGKALKWVSAEGQITLWWMERGVIAILAWRGKFTMTRSCRKRQLHTQIRAIERTGWAGVLYRQWQDYTGAAWRVHVCGGWAHMGNGPCYKVCVWVSLLPEGRGPTSARAYAGCVCGAACYTSVYSVSCSQWCRQKYFTNDITQGKKYTMSNDNLVIYTRYQYWVDVQGYKEIEVDMCLL